MRREPKSHIVSDTPDGIIYADPNTDNSVHIDIPMCKVLDEIGRDYYFMEVAMGLLDDLRENDYFATSIKMTAQ